MWLLRETKLFSFFAREHTASRGPGYLLFLCSLMCAAMEPAISAFFLFWPK